MLQKPAIFPSSSTDCGFKNIDLGKSSTLWDISDSEGVTTHWITYWKDSKGLQAFASSPTHLLGQKNYLAKKYPYLGIMHEMYYSPKGCWETIYNDCPPMGLGQ